MEVIAPTPSMHGHMPGIVPDVVTQHAEEAAFLWLIRDHAVYAPHYSLKDLSRLDSRLEAHLEGLLVAGEAGWEIVRAELKWEEPGEIFAAAAIALLSDDIARMQSVLEASRQSVELSRGMIAALAFLPFERVAARIAQLTASKDLVIRRIGIAASAAQRSDPGKPLIESLSSDSVELRTRSLRAVGELGRFDLLPSIRLQLNDSDDSIRNWASWSAALLGDKGALANLRSLAGMVADPRGIAFDLALRMSDVASASAWRIQLAKDPKTLRQAVQGAGIIGDPAAIPWLFEQMGDDQTARVAGESFTTITGADLALLNLDAGVPEESEAGPNDNPLDDNVSMDPDENLPVPDLEKIKAWWAKNSSSFRPGMRHLLGRPITADSIQWALREGKQRHRHAAALESILSQPQRSGNSLFETRARARLQQSRLRISP